MNPTEQTARLLLKKMGFEVQQLDWVGRKDGKWVIFEIKERELYAPPPFSGTGLDKRQLYLRNQIKADRGLRTILVVFEKGTNKVYMQYLDKLEQGEHFDTKNNIRIYPIKNFIRLNFKKDDPSTAIIGTLVYGYFMAFSIIVLIKVSS